MPDIQSPSDSRMLPGAVLDKTTFLHALRPFSLIVALATCGLGVSLAWRDGAQDGPLAVLVLLTGLVLQMAVNLINDHRDIESCRFDRAQRRRIRRNTRVGWWMMGLVVLAGLYMVSLRGWPLLLLGAVGMLGAWGYTGGALNYKSRGLGIPLVFLLMGIMLVGGAYYVMTGNYSWSVMWLSLPFSLLSALLLLSNELRDYEQDRAEGIGTLTARIGYRPAVGLYYLLSAAVYLISLVLYHLDLLQGIGLLLTTTLALGQPLRLLRAPATGRRRLTPLTGRLYALFSVTFLASVWGMVP